MRVFFGIILGIVITLGAAYIHDSSIPVSAAVPAVPTDPSQPTPPQPVGPTDLTQRRIVHWEVLQALTDQGTSFVREQWNKIFH
jgi:hypothetical protein